MFSFFKRDNVQKELDDNTNSFQEVISVICIMLEISRLDGKVDESEIEEIKKYFDKKTLKNGPLLAGDIYSFC